MVIFGFAGVLAGIYLYWILRIKGHQLAWDGEW